MPYPDPVTIPLLFASRALYRFRPNPAIDAALEKEAAGARQKDGGLDRAGRKGFGRVCPVERSAAERGRLFGLRSE